MMLSYLYDRYVNSVFADIAKLGNNYWINTNKFYEPCLNMKHKKKKRVKH